MAINKKDLIDICKKYGADNVGVASIDRFENVELSGDPKLVLPSVKSVFVLVHSITRGWARGAESHSEWETTYTRGGHLDSSLTIEIAYNICTHIEKCGYDAVPMYNYPIEMRGQGVKVKDYKPAPDVIVDGFYAAHAAGLGQFGKCGIFLTPEFGPRQQFTIILTNAEIEPDPINIGNICDKCKACARGCPAEAISYDEEIAMDFMGEEVKWLKLFLGRCKMCHNGLNKKSSPFLQKKFPGLYIPIEEQEPTWVEALELGLNGFFKAVPIYNAMNGHYPNTVVAQCGGRGCVFECLKHLEKRGRIDTLIKDSPFSSDKPWRLDERPEHDEHNGLVYDAENETYFNKTIKKELKDEKEAPKWY